MSSSSSLFATGAAAVALAAIFAACPAAARADVCDRLWHERNSIYAEAGFCFKTPRARAVFGPRCYPPYGELSPGEQRRINEIKAEEYERGCSD
jgi:hypothetical protein